MEIPQLLYPAPMLKQPQSEKILPNSQSNFPLLQLKTIALCPAPRSHRQWSVRREQLWVPVDLKWKAGCERLLPKISPLKTEVSF